MQPLKIFYQTIAFLLEIGMAIAFYIWASHFGTIPLTHYLFGAGAVVILITYWGFFQAPHALHRLRFPLRITSEIMLFILATLMLCATGHKTPAMIFAAVALFKEILSFVFKE